MQVNKPNATNTGSGRNASIFLDCGVMVDAYSTCFVRADGEEIVAPSASISGHAWQTNNGPASPKTITRRNSFWGEGFITSTCSQTPAHKHSVRNRVYEASRDISKAPAERKNTPGFDRGETCTHSHANMITNCAYHNRKHGEI